jgi:nucleoid DNA-binding protein
MAVKKTAKKAAKKPAAAAKKTAPKAAAVKKAAPVAMKTNAIGEKQTKSQIVTAISEETGLSRKDVSGVFASLGNLVQRHMKKKGSGEFSIPEVGVKIRRVRKPATKARKMISPFTGEEITVKAKPAREVVKVNALKSLKESASK